MADPKKPRPAPPIDDVRKNKATLEKHDKGPSVKEVQKKLASKGYKVGWDGDFGDNTEAAVKAFQQASKIEPSGKVDAATLKAIEAPRRRPPRATWRAPGSRSWPRVTSTARTRKRRATGACASRWPTW